MIMLRMEKIQAGYRSRSRYVFAKWKSVKIESPFDITISH